MDITRDRLVELFDYDREHGRFIWKKSPAPRVKAGTVAGHIRSTDGYRIVKIGYRNYKIARLVWLWETGSFPPDELDHINCDSADDRFENLRPATRSQNAANRRVQCNNRLRVKGVYEVDGRYKSSIRVDGKSRHIGSFDTVEEAGAAYAIAAKEIFGEFARAA